MAMSQLDRIKLMGVIKKKKIEDYNDLYIDSRSNLNIYDFLETTADIALKFIDNDFSEKQIENSLNAVILVLDKINIASLSIEDNNIYKKLMLFKSYKGSYNDTIEELINNIVDLTTKICVVNKEEFEEQNVYEEIQEEQEEIDFEEEYNLSLEQIRELEGKIKSFENQIKSLEKLVEKKEKSHEKLVKKSSEQTGEIRKLKVAVEKLKKLLNKANESSKKYEKELTTYKKELDNSNRENQYLNTKLKDLKEKNSAYRTKNELYDKSISSRETYEKNYQQILELIVGKRLSIKDIEKTLYRSGDRLSYREISDIISQIKLRYYIDERINNFEKSYHVSSPIKKCGEIIDFKTTKKCLDVMVISDSHIGMLSNFDINTVNKVYEYMYKNGIKYILDLGDFFSFYCQAGIKKTEKMSFCERVIDEVIEKYPQSNDISHLLLGGNHDQVLFRYGLDPLMKLDTNRSDFISLGYDYASINFNHDAIGVYHPNFRLDKLSEMKVYEKITDFSKKVWSDSIISFDSLYANLYGHFHKLSITDNGIIMVPSLSYDRDRNGAIHMKIYFDGSGNIESLTFINLIIAAKIFDKEKCEYQKTRSYIQ